MVFENLSILVLWMKVALALEGLTLFLCIGPPHHVMEDLIVFCHKMIDIFGKVEGGLTKSEQKSVSWYI